MALTDEEKLNAAIIAFQNKLDSLSDWDTFQNLISNITPEIVKTFLANKINAQASNYDDESINYTNKADDYEALATEISNIE